jgi:hypothetical protein
MPAFPQHLAKAQSNLSFVDFLKSSKSSFFDWMIVGYFLTALHHVEAYFDSCYGKSYGNHLDRRKAMLQDGRLSSFYSLYRALETYSQTARYGVKQFDQKYVDQRVLSHFQRLKAGIESLEPKLKF